MGTFLKVLGQILSKGLQLAGIFPMIQPLLGSSKAAQVTGTVVNDLTAIGTTVTQMEIALQGKPGADKLAAAVPLVTQIIKTSEMVAGHPIGNEAEFIAGCTDATNAVVRILNSLKADNLKTTGQPNVPPAPPAIPTPAVPPTAVGPAPVGKAG